MSENEQKVKKKLNFKRKTIKKIESFKKIETFSESAAIKIQSWWRGTIYRRKSLPNVLVAIKQHLEKNLVTLVQAHGDGRINSGLDEEVIIKSLTKKFGASRVIKARERWWYDILVIDYRYGRLPVNIKTTMGLTADNSGGHKFKGCLHAYSNENAMDEKFNNAVTINNALFDSISKKQYNKNMKKDYYFLVINKSDTSRIIVNSILGLSEIRHNRQNLPFQIKWSGSNTEYRYKNIKLCIKQFMECMNKIEETPEQKLIKNLQKLSGVPPPRDG